MTGDPRDLKHIQRWMQTVITHPDGVVKGIHSAEARSEVDVTADQVEHVINRSRSQTSIERLRIYANAYYARLLECLREEYPALRHAVGDRVFDGFVFGYLQEHPSRSYTLARLGENFPGYLLETRPRDKGAEGEPTWPDFLIDLARLERAYSEVFDGPGIEGLPLLSGDDLLAVPPERWADVRLVPADSLRLMTFRFPVHEYASAVRHQREARVPKPAETHLAITRREYVVRRVPLTAVQYTLLDALCQRQTLGVAIARAADAADTGVEDFAAELKRWFRAWTAAQFFRQVDVAR